MTPLALNRHRLRRLLPAVVAAATLAAAIPAAAPPDAAARPPQASRPPNHVAVVDTTRRVP
jgi:peptidoglycan/LPS O-acetylase OafA/YrhL